MRSQRLAFQLYSVASEIDAVLACQVGRFRDGLLLAQQAEDGTAIREVCRTAGISEATFYAGRKKYAGLMPSEMQRLRQLEDENGKLKKLVADLPLDRAMLQNVLRRKL
jgi:putative transposase